MTTVYRVFKRSRDYVIAGFYDDGFKSVIGKYPTKTQAMTAAQFIAGWGGRVEFAGEWKGKIK